MSSYAVIARTSETLIELLRERISERTDAIDVDRSKIALASPDDIDEDSDIRLSLSLFEVTYHPTMNTQTRAYDPETNVAREPPLALELRYLLTAHPAQTDDNLTPEAVDQHRLLGLAIQTLHDNSSIDGTEFGGSQFEKNVGIELLPESSANVTDIWRSIRDTSLRPSVVYVVSPILLPSRREEEIPPVEERGMEMEDKNEEGARREQRSFREGGDEDEETQEESSSGTADE